MESIFVTNESMFPSTECTSVSGKASVWVYRILQKGLALKFGHRQTIALSARLIVCSIGIEVNVAPHLRMDSWGKYQAE
jgi:hypothetical protein